MTTKESFIDALRAVAKRVKPLIVSPAVAPLLVVLIGLFLNGSFTVTSKNQVIFGGPTDEVGDVVGVAQAAELVAVNQMPVDADEMDGETGPVTGVYDSVSAGEVSPFGIEAGLSIEGVQVHRVKPGETFYSIARAHGIDQKAQIGRAHV